MLAAFILLLLASVGSQSELYKLMEQAGYPSFRSWGIGIGILLLTSAYYAPGLPILSLAILICCLLALGQADLRTALNKLFSTLFGILYIPFLLKFLILLANTDFPQTGGLLLALWVVVVAKFTDIGGLIIGSAIGNYKLHKRISPGKTWEGAIGGVVIAVAASFFYVVVLREYLPANFTPTAATIIALPVSALSIASDLSESLIKRTSGAKDSGTWIPGIGGFLDLVDSILLSSPLSYWLLILFIGSSPL
jgi:phosphatidate cytidylyltransferase